MALPALALPTRWSCGGGGSASNDDICLSLVQIGRGEYACLTAVEVLPERPGGHVHLQEELGHVGHLRLIVAGVLQPNNTKYHRTFHRETSDLCGKMSQISMICKVREKFLDYYVQEFFNFKSRNINHHCVTWDG
jgi:hypothetical protein